VASSAARVQLAGDAARLKRVAGTYTDASLGTVTLTPWADGLLFDVGEWKSGSAFRAQHVLPSGRLTRRLHTGREVRRLAARIERDLAARFEQLA
jgi:hypothetical protein